MTTANTSKFLSLPGDYYFCSLCAAWHRCTNDPSSTGMARTTKTDEQFMDDERKNDKLSKIQNGMH